MKIQCDVCEKEEAIVFCPADEAALCQACDDRVHHANKLATKHHRFNLLHSQDCPTCDICKERRALLFCQQDRAILCRECDGTIHKANEYTNKHNRFLLTGAKLSANTTCTYQASTGFHYYPTTAESSNPTKTTSTTTTSVMNNLCPNNNSYVTTPESTLNFNEVNTHCYGNQMGSVSTSSISDYLMETLPGWRVDDFLDQLHSPYGF